MGFLRDNLAAVASASVAVAGTALWCALRTRGKGLRESEKAKLTTTLLEQEFAAAASESGLSVDQFDRLCTTLHARYQGLQWLREDEVLQRYVFRSFDVDGNGMVDQSEFLAGMLVLCVGSDDEKCDRLFQILDESGDTSNSNGLVELTELEEFLHKDMQNKVALAPVWSRVHGGPTTVSPLVVSAALSSGDVLATALGGLLAMLQQRSDNAAMDAGVTEQIHRCAQFKAIELRQRVAAYADEEDKLDKHQFKQAYQAVLKDLFCIRGLAREINRWMDEAESKVGAIVAMVDSERGSADTLTEPELQRMVGLLYGEATKLDDHPELRALVGQPASKLRTLLLDTGAKPMDLDHAMSELRQSAEQEAASPKQF